MTDQLAAGKAFVLDRLRRAKGRRAGRAALLRPNATLARLGLDAPALEAVLDDLAAGGHLESFRLGRSVSYRLTDAGAEHLAGLPPPPGVKPAPVEDPHLGPYQRAFLLLQLLAADGRALDKASANKLGVAARRDLELSAAVANALRGAMAARGFIAVSGAGRGESYRLTDAGAAHLATLDQHDAATFALRGRTINALLAAARPAGADAKRAPSTDAGDSPDAPDVTPPRAGPGDAQNRDGEPRSGHAIDDADLPVAAYAVFRELLGERHARIGMVPIFEVRRELARRHGADAARHDRLDPVILRLWREGRVRAISISDRRDAAADELADAIGDGYETLYYLEDGDARTTGR